MKGFGFQSVGHFFAVVAGDLVKAGKIAAQVETKAASLAPVVEGITAVVAPQFVEVERAAFSLLGAAAHAVSDAGEASGQNGLNVTLDAQTVADLKALIPAILAFAKSQGVAAPAPAK